MSNSSELRSSPQEACPRCQAVNAAGSPYCDNCGTKLSSVNYGARGLMPTGMISLPTTLRARGTVLSNNWQIVGEAISSPGGLTTYPTQGPQGEVGLFKEAPLHSRAAQDLGDMADILARINHPGLPTIQATFEESGVLCLCLRSVQGRPLREVWQNSSEHTYNHLLWIGNLCETLFALHQNDVVALEILPDDVIIAADGSRVGLRDVPMLTKLEYLNANPEVRRRSSLYAAPELYTAPTEVGPRSDVYALGALWLSLILGRSLVPNLMTEQRNLRPPSEIGAPSQYWPLENRLIARALQRSPADRYKSALFFRDAITVAAEDFKAVRPMWQECLTTPSVAGWTDMGMDRDNNEDNFLADAYPSGAFLMVADGMGGAEGGEIASAIVKEVAKEKTLPALTTRPAFQTRATAIGPQTVAELPNIEQTLREAINTASRQVNERAHRDPHLKGMGSTVVMAIVVDGQLHVANVGDSRAFLIPRDGPGVIQVSTDHSQLFEMRRKQSKALSKVDKDAYKSVLSRNIGNRETADAAYMAVQPALQSGDMVLLCSDGLTDALSEAEIAQIVADHHAEPNLLALCFHLINKANYAGGHDNTTVVLYRQP